MLKSPSNTKDLSLNGGSCSRVDSTSVALVIGYWPIIAVVEHIG